MKNKKKILLGILLIFLIGLFLALGSSNAKAAQPSQCSGSCGDTQTCAGAAGFTAALKSQCETQFGAGSCNSMNGYLSQMASDCVYNNQAALVAGDCSNIPNGNRYGACAVIYAEHSGSGFPIGGADPDAPPATTGGGGVPLPKNTGLSDKTVVQILTQLLNWLLQIVGIIAIMGFVISGIMYLVSAGNEEMITKAKKYMLYCLIGVVVVLASFVVVKTIDSILNASIGI